MINFTFTANTQLEYAKVLLPASNRYAPVLFVPQMNCVVASDDGMRLMEFAGGGRATAEVADGGFIDGTPLKLIPAYCYDIDHRGVKCLQLGYRDISNDYIKDDSNHLTAHILVNQRTNAVTAISETPLAPRHDGEYAAIICHQPSDIYPYHYSMLVGCHVNVLHHNPHLNLTGAFNQDTLRIECHAHTNRNTQYFVLEDSMISSSDFRYQLFTCSKTNKEPSYLVSSVDWHIVNEETATMPIFMSSHPTY